MELSRQNVDTSVLKLLSIEMCHCYCWFYLVQRLYTLEVL